MSETSQMQFKTTYFGENSVKRTVITLIASLLAISTFAVGQERTNGNAIARSAKRGELNVREIGGFVPDFSTLTSYIWTNKYAYSPNEAITLRWTSAPNNELYPVTTFLYRTNLQTGERIYWPNATADVTDIDGNTEAQGYSVQRVPANAKATLLGAGGRFTNGTTAPGSVGNYEFVLEVRDYTGTQVLNASHAKFNVVSETVTVTDAISTNTTWTSDKLYVLRGGIFVTSGTKLTVEPGTVILGTQDGVDLSFLSISRGAQLIANGTWARPIVFSTDRPAGNRNTGDWGGLIFHGNATINVPGGTARSEGISNILYDQYGGNDDNSSCGELKYVRVEYGGRRITQDNELNGIAFHGCGLGTKVDYVQSHLGADDAIEWFGGNMQAKHLVASVHDDDGLDWTEGFRGKIQHTVSLFTGDTASNDPRGIEADGNGQNFELTPLAMPIIYNFTTLSVEHTLSQDGVLLRRGTGAKLYNGIVSGFGTEALDLADGATISRIGAGMLDFTNIVVWNNNWQKDGFTNGQFTVSNQVDSDVNNNIGNFSLFAFDPKLTKGTDVSDPDFRPQVESPLCTPGIVSQPPDDGFFDTDVTCLGGVQPGKDWTRGWTSFIRDIDVR